MKGVIFNLLENFICETWGDEKYEEILSLCPLKTKKPFVGPGTYPDSDLMTIANKTAEILGVSLDDALKSFGRYAFPRLAQRYPNFLENIHTARDFLLTVDSVIHVEVKKLYPNAETPKFSYQDLSETHLVMTYTSKRNLFSLVEGFIEGVSDFFDTPIAYQRKDAEPDNNTCVFDLHFASKSE